LRLSPVNRGGTEEDLLALVGGLDLSDGTIEIDVAGAPREDAPPGMRGFIGVAFRVQADGARYEKFFLRPTNGRAEDQLRRNHAVQYVSVPEHPWHRLRKESPGMYESYADLEAGAWTRLRIEFSGRGARLYVNGAAQPSLVVNDLKLGKAGGGVALWVHRTTEGYFSNLSVLKRK
jgi:hypothetical protein